MSAPGFGIFVDTDVRPTVRTRGIQRPASAWDVAKATANIAMDDSGFNPDKAKLEAASRIMNSIPDDVPMPFVLELNPFARGADIFAEKAWRRLSSARQRYGATFLPDVPATRAEFDEWMIEPVKQRRGADMNTVSRGSGVISGIAGFAGGMAGSFTDPLNLATLPLGGSAKTVAGRMASEFALNATIEAAEQPIVAANRKSLGETLTASEALQNIAMAGAGGAALRGAGEAAGVVLRRSGLMPDHAAAAQLEAAVPPDLRTPDQQAALHVLNREADVTAVNPYETTPAGMDAHAARVKAAMEALDNPQLVMRATASAAADRGTPLAVLRGGPREALSEPDARSAIKAAIRRAESPNDFARNPNSSAQGRYQFTDGTFLSTYKRVYGDTGESRAAILARKTDGAVQERLMDRLVDDNAATLRAIGAPITKANLYILHFAGEKGGAKLVRAADDTPIRAVLGDRAVNANPFLEGMTAAQARAELARRVGGKAGPAAPDGASPDIMAAAPDPALDAVRPAALADDVDAEIYLPEIPQLRRADYADDAAWRAAQDAHDREWYAARGDLSPVQRDMGGGAVRQGDTPDRAQAGIETGASAPLTPEMIQWRDNVDMLRMAQAGELPQAIRHQEVGPIDVIWGDAGTPAKNHADGHGLAKIIAKHPEVVDRLPQIVEGMTVTSRSDNRIRMESADHSAVVRLDYDGERKTWLLTAFEKGKTPAATKDGRAAADSRTSSGTGTTDISADQRLVESADMTAAATDTARAADFTDPAGSEAAAQTDRITHDLRNEAERDSIPYRLEDGDATIADALSQLDADDAALAAIRGCL